jgi:hypothetical protein
VHVIPMAADAVGLAGILEHFGRHALTAERKVHLLDLFIGHTLFRFSRDKYGRRADFAGMRQWGLRNHVLDRVLGEFLEIMRQWEFDRGRDSVAATGTNQVLAASALPQDRAAFLLSPSAHVVD